MTWFNSLVLLFVFKTIDSDLNMFSNSSNLAYQVGGQGASFNMRNLMDGKYVFLFENESFSIVISL